MQEWYLMNSKNKPNSLGGYENNGFSDLMDDAFAETLGTDIADTVIIFSADLSEQKEVRCIIQGNSPDTRLKTMDRQILCDIGTVKAGMYVYFEENYWLVTGRSSNNKFYEKNTMSLCNYLLKWQAKTGEIISRWAVIASAAKYNDGIDGNSVIRLGSDQLSVQIPLDTYAERIKRNVRFLIDYNKDEPTVYALTNPSNVLYCYGENNGITNWIVQEKPYSPTPKELELGVCDYVEPEKIPTIPEESSILPTPITYSGYPVCKAGGSYKTFKSYFTNSSNESISEIGIWEIRCDFSDKLAVLISDNQIKIKVHENNSELIGEKFELVFLNIDRTISTKIDVTIEEYS